MLRSEVSRNSHAICFIHDFVPAGSAGSGTGSFSGFCRPGLLWRSSNCSSSRPGDGGTGTIPASGCFRTGAVLRWIFRLAGGRVSGTGCVPYCRCLSGCYRIPASGSCTAGLSCPPSLLQLPCAMGSSRPPGGKSNDHLVIWWWLSYRGVTEKSAQFTGPVRL